MSGETNDALYAGLGDDEHRQELRKRGMNAGPRSMNSGQNGVHEKSPISVRGGLPPPQRVNKPMPELDFSKEDDSSDEEESARILTPEEAASFRSNVHVSVRKAEGSFCWRLAKSVLYLFACALAYYLFLNAIWIWCLWYHSRDYTPLFTWDYLRNLLEAFLIAIKWKNAGDEL